MVNPKPKPRPAVRNRGNRTPFFLALGAIAVAGASGLGYLATKPKTAAVMDVDPSVPLPEGKGFTIGNPNAPVTVIEFADFECPSCGQFATVTEPDVRKRLVSTGQVFYRYLDYPLPGHRNTWPASMAAHCAADQNKFWEMHDRLFAGQFEWNGEATSNPKKFFKGYATELALDVPKWEQCFDSNAKRNEIAANKREGEKRAISQTPTFVIGRKVLPGALPYDQFKAYVDTAAALAPAAPAAAVPAKPAGSK